MLVEMSGSEEETYSVMFSSLRHPARRKILRMLSEKAMTFSQMLKELSIPSSHLTYHLENLGELVIKENDGKYRLSSFGKASVSMMRGAEEVPNSHSKRFMALPLRWKSFYAALIIGVLLLASLAYVQYVSLNSLSSDYGRLQADYNDVKAQNQRMLAYTTVADKAMAIIRSVVQIDGSKYQATLLSDTVEDRADLGGVVEEIMKYSFVNTESRIEVTLRFRNSHFSLLQINQLEGLPSYPLVYTEPQPTDVLQATRGLLERYKSVMNDSYLDETNMLLASANETSNAQTLGNTKLTISDYGGNAEVLLQYTENGTDFAAKSLHLFFQNHVLSHFSDDWFLFRIGNVQVNISREQAILIAKNVTKSYSWNASGVQVSNFDILDNPLTAEFYPHPRAQDLTLIPYWYVTLYLDKTYPGGVTVIAVGVWADTGEAANIQALGSPATP
jgi:DNA-binding transcriptional ArsR family regulator